MLKMRNVKMSKNFIFLFFAVAMCMSCDDGGGSLVTQPIFTDPAVKLSQVSSQDFTALILSEAVEMEPTVNTSGAQIHMGFWSAAGNHGSLVRVLDSINATSSSATPPQRAIWDEGVSSSIQYPQYVLMNNEFWYERASFTDGVGVIRGITYADPYPVTMANANDIWGGYSQRYADMATSIQQATGNTVKVWCFVAGARRSRVFFTYEFPELQTLEAANVVQVFFAKTIDADWTVSADWDEGTQNAPTPVDGNIASYSFSREPVQVSIIEEEAAFEIADAYLDGAFGFEAGAGGAALNELARRNPGFSPQEYEDAFARGIGMASR